MNIMHQKVCNINKCVYDQGAGVAQRLCLGLPRYDPGFDSPVGMV